MNKPTHVKPQFYSECILLLKNIARQYGYNLVVHGSMNRDLDLIAVPWSDELKEHEDMVKEFAKVLGGRILFQDGKVYGSMPHGRISYVINLYRGGYNKNDPENYIEDPMYYLDIAVFPPK